MTDYHRIYRPDHSKADRLGLVAEHIILMEEMLGRPLNEGEVVHHKDFHKPNNACSNLQNMMREEHQQIPAMQARFLSEQGLMDQFFEWWKREKYSVKTEVQKLEIELVRKENKALRMKYKLKAQGKL